MDARIAFIVLIVFLQTPTGVESQSSQELLGPSCSALVQPRVEVLIQEEGGVVVFNFFAQQGCDDNYRVVRDERVVSVVVTNMFREEVWKIEAQDISGRTASTVTYGAIPSGFIQTVPKFGKAPRLEKSEDYSVNVLGQGRGAATFVYHGVGKHSVKN